VWVSFDASSSANTLKMDAGLTIVFFLSPTERVLEGLLPRPWGGKGLRLNACWLASWWLLLAEYISGFLDLWVLSYEINDRTWT
jgi:hypothetical protein